MLVSSVSINMNNRLQWVGSSRFRLLLSPGSLNIDISDSICCITVLRIYSVCTGMFVTRTRARLSMGYLKILAVVSECLHMRLSKVCGCDLNCLIVETDCVHWFVLDQFWRCGWRNISTLLCMVICFECKGNMKPLQIWLDVFSWLSSGEYAV